MARDKSILAADMSSQTNRKYRYKQVTLDGRTQDVGSARRSILKKIYKAKGNLRVLTKNERNWILQDTAESTQTIREALNDGDTQLSDKQLANIISEQTSKA